MEVIKKKMQALKEKLEQAEEQAAKSEEELDATNVAADKKEEESTELLEELASIEDKLDEQEDRLNSLKTRYDEATKLADENERAHSELRNRGQIDTTKLDRLQNELDELLEKNEQIELDYQDQQAKLEEAEALLDEEEDRFTQNDLRVKELEVEAVQTGNLLRSMEINECVAAKSHNKSYSRVEEMKDNLTEITTRAEEKELESRDLDQKLIELDDDLQAAKDRFQQVKADYDALLAEVAEI